MPDQAQSSAALRYRHETAVQTLNAYSPLYDRRYRAACDCGWTGRNERIYYGAAEQDGLDHEERRNVR